MKLKIEITTTEEGKTSFRLSQPTSLEVTTQILLTVQLALMKAQLASVPVEHQPKVKEHVYDMVNVAASNMLTQYAPDIELRPDLTAEAILQHENQLIEEKYEALSEQEKQKGKKAYKEAKESL